MCVPGATDDGTERWIHPDLQGLCRQSGGVGGHEHQGVFHMSGYITIYNIHSFETLYFSEQGIIEYSYIVGFWLFDSYSK